MGRDDLLSVLYMEGKAGNEGKKQQNGRQKENEETRKQTRKGNIEYF